MVPGQQHNLRVGPEGVEVARGTVHHTQHHEHSPTREGLEPAGREVLNDLWHRPSLVRTGAMVAGAGFEPATFGL